MAVAICVSIMMCAVASLNQVSLAKEVLISMGLIWLDKGEINVENYISVEY